jgi:hypothetical protein
LFLPLNATSSISKPAHTARMISSIRARCRVAEHPVPKLRHKTKGVSRVNTAHTSADAFEIGHKPR